MRFARFRSASVRFVRRSCPPAIYIGEHAIHDTIDGEMGCKVGMRHGLMRSHIITYIFEDVNGVAAGGGALICRRRG